ncbi:SH3 domain-containing protein [Nitrospina watsonii]|uniref:SH3b domain-containing protein n=1 Tax=Nitrospina watsonii TaxID=1323948 RepID=A0ABM9HDX6_9BACT|nr:SH3 domain-containing protein [Nitrospina watsonii]CAI2718275.1 SH3b domain-containing protein [Nitrospina watsonii]
MEEKQAHVTEYCVACQKPLPPNAVFCFNCEAPKPPPPQPEGGLPLGKAAFSIVCILLAFAAVVALKMGVSLTEGIPKTGEEIVAPEDRPQDEDLKIIHYVNADRVNVRAEPKLDSPVILVVGKGEKIAVTEKNDDWSKVLLNGKSGWIATDLLSARVE